VFYGYSSLAVSVVSYASSENLLYIVSSTACNLFS